MRVIKKHWSITKVVALALFSILLDGTIALLAITFFLLAIAVVAVIVIPLGTGLLARQRIKQIRNF